MPSHAVRTLRGLWGGRLTYVHAGVTHRCNLRCTMCGVYRRAGKLPEASPRRWRETAKVLADLGATTVSLGGGEPFLRRDLPEIVAAFADHGFRVRVLTNGVAIAEEPLRACLAAGLADLSFSLDTLDEKRQERFDGLPGGLPQRLANLAMLSQVLPPKVRVLINTVINDRNLDDLLRLSDLAYRLGHFISFIPVHLREGEGDDFFGADPALRIAGEKETELRRLIDQLIADKRRRRHIANSRAFLAAIPDFLLHGKTDWICRAGRTYLSLRPDAKASICHHYETSDAIEVERIAAEWSSSKVRQSIAACPNCLRPCWTEVALLTRCPSAIWDQMRLQLRGVRLRPPLSEMEIRKLAGLEA